MANTYTLISSDILTSSQASVTFSSIPATYSDLVLSISARSNVSSNQDTINLRFNGNTGSIYSNVRVFGSGSTSGSNTNANLDRMLAPYSNGNTATSNSFGSIEVYIPSYLVSQNKPLSAFGVSETDSATAYMAITAGLFSSTTAISSMTIAPENGTSWLSGSSFYLYGIKNS